MKADTRPVVKKLLKYAKGIKILKKKQLKIF